MLECEGRTNSHNNYTHTHENNNRRYHRMGMTMTQKILAAHAGLKSVQAGQLIEASLDLVLGNDITSPVAIHEME